ncbi:uncharacterized protein BO72DRAFT_83644 [Aspergillus fijiensis CBS 313.89]|uniref:Uncharacterized protein n=1 Tax=Aspergillus fijiensis CBS 313.89 TaxID=1448319 RepID=A0A8G1VYS0_9EURO|nr:uncharacterized protein BO72DRAFT_83644 [Aspergillus fijiensis CBS 313.89]RAK78015.1 hypothetical protein BO72DRAFT_83644 [Aspergillus fijiensis CBS 313.89]
MQACNGRPSILLHRPRIPPIPFEFSLSFSALRFFLVVFSFNVFSFSTIFSESSIFDWYLSYFFFSAVCIPSASRLRASRDTGQFNLRLLASTIVLVLPLRHKLGICMTSDEVRSMYTAGRVFSRYSEHAH